MIKQFAPEYARNEFGWVKFPTKTTETEYRKALFPPEVNQHPAKANVFLVQAIIEYVSKPGDTLLDIMAGTGTLMVGALIDRAVICVEISEKFHNLQLRARQMLDDIAPGVSNSIVCINMPCQAYLPIPDLANHIIFSPQYAGILKTKGKDSLTIERHGSYDFVEYSKHPLNLGTMSEFIWAEEMERIYKKCFDSLTTPGSMTLIIKDHMSAGQRVPLVRKAIDASIRAGFISNPAEHFKWLAPGMAYTQIRRSQGKQVVDDESIVVLRKLP